VDIKINKGKKEGKEKKINEEMSPRALSLAYHHGPSNKDKERQFTKFLDMIKSL